MSRLELRRKRREICGRSGEMEGVGGHVSGKFEEEEEVVVVFYDPVTVEALPLRKSLQFCPR